MSVSIGQFITEACPRCGAGVILVVGDKDGVLKFVGECAKKDKAQGCPPKEACNAWYNALPSANKQSGGKMSRHPDAHGRHGGTPARRSS